MIKAGNEYKPEDDLNTITSILMLIYQSLIHFSNKFHFVKSKIQR